MTTQKLFKRRVRQRMSKTGESYTAARANVARVRDRLAPQPDPLDGATELASDQRITEATGRDWRAWLALLDRWGARERKRSETVAFLMTEQSVPGWWAQTIATGFERTRGLRLKHQQADGFTIYASKTVDVPVGELFAAFSDEGLRARWLTDGSVSPRVMQPEKAARFEWEDGRTRVNVTFEAKGPAKSTAFVAHERLADPAEAEAAKAAWKERLAVLKRLLAARASPE